MCLLAWCPQEEPRGWGQRGFVTPPSPFWDALGQMSPLAWAMRVTVAPGGSYHRTDKDWVVKRVFVQWQRTFGGRKLQPQGVLLNRRAQIQSFD